ncbi:MAG: hypothetical protein ACTS3T_00730 [Almyronema sp.]
MALPPSIRYLFARLQPAAQPVVWGPVLVLTLLGVVFWEYRNHPEWLAGFEIDRQSPSVQLPETELTLDEQAALAQVDSLDVLLADLDASTPAIQPDTPEASLFNQLTKIADSEPLRTNNYSPYNSNPAQPRPVSPPSTLDNPARSTASALNLSALLGTETAAEPSQASALQTALSRLPTQTENSEGRSPASSATQPSTAPDRIANTDAAASATLPGTRPGVGPIRFIPTTPSMSPPPGTTGYTPPATLNLAPNNYPGGNAYTNLTTPALPQVQSGFDNLPNRAATTPVLPPSASNLYSQPQVPQVPQNTVPFSVPRPPGAYLGGGQIQTFSNPLGSSTWGPEDYPSNYNY